MDDDRRPATPSPALTTGEQQRVILEESELRKADRDAAPDTHLEHRRSEDTVEPLD